MKDIFKSIICQVTNSRDYPLARRIFIGSSIKISAKNRRFLNKNQIKFILTLTTKNFCTTDFKNIFYVFQSE